MAIAHHMQLSNGVEVFVNYNANNLRIGNVEWIIPGGVSRTIHARITNNITQAIVYETTETASGSQNVPGNNQMVEIADDLGFFELPLEFDYFFRVF